MRFLHFTATGPVRMVTYLAIVVAVLVGATFVFHTPTASADTQYAGAIRGKTYRSNYVYGYGYQSVWGQTTVLSGVTWHYIREELHPQHYIVWPLEWQTDPTQVVTDYASQVTTTFYGYYKLQARGWSWHKDWYTGDAVNTSDGY
jgi:hypothetical protein